MFHVGRENRRRLVFEKVRQAFDSLITNNYRFGLPHTVNRLAYAQRPSGDFRVGKDFKNQDAKTTIDACETRGLSLREMLLALSQDVHTHLEYLATIAAAEPFDPVRFEFPNEGHKTRAWAWFWQLQCALERIVRENAVGVGGWCLGCFISHRQTELGADDHWQCPHGCYLG